MSERPGMSGTNPTDLWRQWYEMGSRMWQGPMQAGGDTTMMDPWGLYRQWFEGMETVREQTMQAVQGGMSGMPGMDKLPSMPGIDTEQAAATWRKVVEATVEGWQKSADMTNEMLSLAPKWQETVEQARNNLLSIEKFPTDPLEFAVQWYNATSGPYSEFVQELIEREEFLAPASQFLQNYASFYKLFRKNSEDYLKNLQIPTRSDITRIASLVVALEEKVDNVEEALEDMQDAQNTTANDGKIEALEKQLSQTEDKVDRVESKLDQIIAILNQPSDTSATDDLDDRVDQVEGKHDQLPSSLGDLGPDAETGSENAPASESANGNGSGSAQGSDSDEIRATDAAKRKASDLGVDLATVTGTGSDGLITVEDVRKKGEA
ncbi:MAG: E3 binding domain-containing protein [Rubrobacter sp.]